MSLFMFSFKNTCSKLKSRLISSNLTVQYFFIEKFVEEVEIFTIIFVIFFRRKKLNKIIGSSSKDHLIRIFRLTKSENPAEVVG